MNQKSQQLAESAGLTPPRLPHIEIEETIFRKLGDISTRENITLRELISELLKYMLVQHRRELRQIIETLKKRAFR